jgi:hypothetical protein
MQAYADRLAVREGVTVDSLEPGGRFRVKTSAGE